MLPISLELPCFFLSLSPPSSRPPLSLSSSPHLSSSFFPFCLPPFLLSPFLPSSFYFSFLPLFLSPSFLSHSPSLSLFFSPSIPVSLSLLQYQLSLLSAFCYRQGVGGISRAQSQAAQSSECSVIILNNVSSSGAHQNHLEHF